ncbi:MAG: TonB-dependent receptor [Sphingomonadaceae bacterium]|nr:TonB-dependent receptor [Sphingomonadaceae bacterium]
MPLRWLLSAPIALAPTPALAQASGEEERTIIVTGTRRTDRTVLDSPVPIDVLGSEQLQVRGLTETARALRDLVPSFNFPQPSITDGTDVIRPATLRGLGPDQTLVLVNGKRRHLSALLNINASVGRGTQAVDINMIPAPAIARVEVLRDGAAAQYGSDAIAGVINFQLRDERQGARFAITAGTHRGRVKGVEEVTGVARDAAGTPLLAPDSTLRLETTGEDRKARDGDFVSLQANLGLPLLAQGHLNFTVEYRDRALTNRAGYDPRRQYNVAAVYDPREFTFNRLSHLYGDAQTEDVAVVVNAGLPFDDALKLYAFGTFGHREGLSAGFYRRSNDNRNVIALYPDGFLPRINTKAVDFAVTAGIEGELLGANFDLSLGYGRNAFDFRVKNSVNASLGVNSPTEFDSGGLRYDQLLLNLDVTRGYDWLAGVTFAAGVEWRRETYRVRPGELASYQAGPVRVGENNPQFTGPAGQAFAAPGAQVFPGFQPVVGGVDVTRRNARENVSVYLEVDANVTDRIGLQLAGRYEDYTDFGSDWNGKAAGRWQMLDALALRGAVSTGFRAPGLAQQFFAASATNNIGGVLLDSVTLPNANPVALALGSTPLKPETSWNVSAGGVLTPAPRVTLTVDWYRIDIDDRIVLTDNLIATRDAAGNPTGPDPGRGIARILNDAGFRSISAARFFFNGIDTRTQGLDVIANWRPDLGDGQTLALTVGYNRNRTRITGRQDLPGALNQVPGIVLFGRLESLRIERGQPVDRVNLVLDYERARFGFTLRANRFGEVLSPGLDPLNDLLMEPRWVSDLETRVRPLPRLELALGADNLFNTYPTRAPVGLAPDPATGQLRALSVNNYFLPFSSFSPFGFNGRFLYLRVSLDF